MGCQSQCTSAACLGALASGERRLRAVPVDDMVGRKLVLDSASGLVLLDVLRPARPCAWMDAAIGPGARAALLRKGGVRCVPLTDDRLRVGPVCCQLT